MLLPKFSTVHSMCKTLCNLLSSLAQFHDHFLLRSSFLHITFSFNVSQSFCSIFYGYGEKEECFFLLIINQLSYESSLSFSPISSSTFAGLVGHYSHPFSQLQNFLFTILNINHKPGILCALTSHLNHFALEPFISNVALLANFISMSVPFHELSSLHCYASYSLIPRV